MTIADIQAEIVDEFSFFEDWQQKYEYIIELGKSLPSMNEDDKQDDLLIKGCQSKVWLHASVEQDMLHFEADSDGILTKGMVALLLRIYNNQPISEIMQSNIDFIEKIGLHEFLSPNRANGLMAIIKQIKYYAIVYQSQNARNKA